MKSDLHVVRSQAEQIRSALEPAFSAETALPGSNRWIPSAGHCAAVAAIVRRQLGGWLVSAVVGHETHWFNRLRAGKRLIDVDLTGDQFGRAPIQIATFGRLYHGTRVRRPSELLPETLARSEKLEQRSHLETNGSRTPQHARCGA
jgi:hypothetical protein